MDISKMSVLELKAMAYDLMAQIQNLQSQAGALNQIIAEKSKEVSPNPAAPAAPVEGEVI